MAILRKLFWLVIFLISTLSFVVLFEHGVDNFGVNFQKQFHAFVEGAKEVASGTGKKKTDP